MRKKIIHILPHNIYKFYPKIRENSQNLASLDHHSTKFILNIINTDRENIFTHELWTIGDVDNIFEINHNYGFKIKVFPQDFNIFLPLETSFSMFSGINNEIKKQEDILWHIHSYYLFMFDFIVSYLKIKGQIIFAHHRGGGFTFKALPYSIYKYIFILPIILRFCSKIFAQNNIEFNKLKYRYFINDQKLVYFPNTIDVSLNTSKNNISDVINLCFIGRLEKIKGINDILNSLKFLKENNLKLKITFIGDGSMNKEIIDFCNKNKLDYFITGWILKNEIDSILKNQNIFLIANKKAEGSSNSVLEAQSFGLPVISYDIEGINDFVINNKTGYLVNNFEEFKEKLLFLSKNKEVVEKFSLNSIENIKNNFSKKNYFEKLLEIYKKQFKL